MTEIQGLDKEHTVQVPYEHQDYHEESGTWFWRDDVVAPILAGIIAICGVGLLLLFMVPLMAVVQNVLGINLPGINSAARWLSTGSKGLILAVALVVIGVLSYVYLRQRMLNNAQLYTEVGCPSCKEHELIRVRRRQNDRIVSRLGIPVQRYVCRNCSWDGLRLGGSIPYVVTVQNVQENVLDDD